MRSIRRNGQGILNREVLVLNQNYQPLLVCTAKRAICLIYLEKVEVLENYRREVHSPTIVLPLPSVVKLNRYIAIRGNDVILSRKNIFKRDHHLCQYCGRKGIPMTIDHIIPREKGGKDTWQNLVTSCHQCNRKKGNKTLTDCDLKLLKKPKRPTRIHYIQKFVKKEQASWRQYLYMESDKLPEALA
tara:strand:- start:13291 stop:13851 length:561 start_codon:yes stop_codon:yes gene_type:complete